MIILRDYQELAINLLARSIGTGHKRPILKLPTGAGKTAIAGELIQRATKKGNRVAFIVPKLTLVDQASAHLDAIEVDHGIIQGDNIRTDYSKNVQVISAQTLIRRKPWNFDLGIVDEAHTKFKGITELMQTWDNIPFIGLTATPFTKGLGKIYDDLVCPIDINELIKRGYLVDADAFGPSKPDMTGARMSGDDYNQKDAAERSNTDKLVANIVETWQKLGGNKQTICFATDVAHSKHIAERFQAAGINAVHIDAYTDSDERRRYIADFKKGIIKILVSVGVLHTGFDAPNAEVCIIARPTKSLSLHIQMIGRILRTCEGKVRGLILDHAGNIERLGFHTDPTPDVLDDGESAKETIEEKEEREEKLPTPCPNCASLMTPVDGRCVVCGTELRKRNKLKEGEGELKKLKRNNRDMTWEEKIIMMSGFKWYAEKQGYKPGWASYAYKSVTGVWPNDKRVKYAEPKEANERTKNYIKYLQIKRANQKKADSTDRKAF